MLAGMKFATGVLSVLTALAGVTELAGRVFALLTVLDLLYSLLTWRWDWVWLALPWIGIAACVALSFVLTVLVGLLMSKTRGQDGASRGRKRGARQQLG